MKPIHSSWMAKPIKDLPGYNGLPTISREYMETAGIVLVVDLERSDLRAVIIRRVMKTLAEGAVINTRFVDEIINLKEHWHLGEQPQSVLKVLVEDARPQLSGKDFFTLIGMALERCSCCKDHETKRTENGWWVHRASPQLGWSDCGSHQLREWLRKKGLMCCQCGDTIPLGAPESSRNLCAKCFGRATE